MPWRIDDSEGTIDFAVRRLGITTARGRFTRFGGTAEAGPDGLPKRLEIRIDASSISTGNPKRDAELVSPAYLDAARFPEIVFRSTGLDWEDDHICTFRGELQLHGITNPVSFLVTVGDVASDDEGTRRIAAEAAGAVSTARWDVHRQPGFTGGVAALGERVTFTAMVKAVADTAPAG